MTKAVLIGSILQLTCVIIIAFLNFIQHKSYAQLVVSSVNISRNMNEMMSSVYDAQEIVNTYVEEGTGSVTSDNVESIFMQAENARKLLKMDVEQLGDANLQNIYVDMESQYTILNNNIKNLVKKIEMDEPITTREYNYLIEQPVKNLQGISGKIVVQVSMKNEKNITSGNQLSTIIMFVSIIMVVVVLISVIYCLKKVTNNGSKMALQQEKAEQYASESMKKAYTDNLTGLWNRKYTENCVNQVIRQHGKGYLFMFDMDNFKSVNDTYGHIAGDNVLKAFAKVMEKTSRKSDICCRIGGDEFMLFAYNLEQKSVDFMAERLIHNTIMDLQKVQGGTNVTVSIGITAITDDIKDFQQLYDRADSALYQIKKNGKNDYCIK